MVKLKLLKVYCSDFYGSVLWDMSHSCVEDVCIAWRNGLRRALSLPGRTHCDLLPLVTGMLPSSMNYFIGLPGSSQTKQYCKVCFSLWCAF